MSNENGAISARVELLTAEVRTVVVGRRQVTLSVYRQLDTVQRDRIEPMGRVRDNQDNNAYGRVYVIGRDRETGALVRSSCRAPETGSGVRLDDALGSHIEGVFEAGPETYPIPELNQTGYASIPVLGEPRCVAFIYKYISNQYWATENRHARPEYWRYETSEGRQLVRATAERALTEQRQLRETYGEWAPLPLIVLAGLR